jgi:predicted nucleic acid-binding Zn ribbon protein
VPAATATTVSWADMTSSARGGCERCKARVRRQLPTLPVDIPFI